MENIIKYIKFAVVGIGTGATWLLGDWDTAVITLICFIVLDYITGMLRAYINKEVSSSVGLIGIARKSIIFIVLIVAVTLDRLLSPGDWVFRTLVCYFYIANESISIIENCSAMGLPIPEQLKDVLAQLQNGNKKGNKEELK